MTRINNRRMSVRQELLHDLRMLARAPLENVPRILSRRFALRAECAVSHPINQLRGLDEIASGYWLPLKQALPDLERRDEILLGGDFNDGHWVAASGYYYGTLMTPWLGLPPSHNWLALRFGEFYRLDGDWVVDAYLCLDLIDVLRQLGCNPLPVGRGVETLCPGPATRDGLLLEPQDPAEGHRSGQLVGAMIIEGLMAFDQMHHESIGMQRYWHQDMMWYGPCGIGTTRGLTGFLERHQHPWQAAYPDYALQVAGIDAERGLAALSTVHEHPWQARSPDYRQGRDLVRIAEGHYVAWNGWPSVHATHTGHPLFGLEPSGRSCTIRIMDFWRRDGELLAENWVFIDIPDMLLQLGFDVLTAAREREP